MVSVHRKPLDPPNGEPGQTLPYLAQVAYLPDPKLKRWWQLRAPRSRQARPRAPLPATESRTPANPYPPTPGAYLAAQLAARVDAQRPGHMLALGQGQQQVVGDSAGPRRAPRAVAGAGRGGRRLRTAGRAGGAEVVRGAGALGKARALGRHGRRVVRVQEALGRGAPGGREQQGRAAGLRGATHGRAHGTDPHPGTGRSRLCTSWDPRGKALRLIPAHEGELKTELGSAPTGSKARAAPGSSGCTRGPHRPRVRGSEAGSGPQIPAGSGSGRLAGVGRRYCCRGCGQSGVLEVSSREDRIPQVRQKAGQMHFPTQEVRSESRINFSAALGSVRVPELPACV